MAALSKEDNALAAAAIAKFFITQDQMEEAVEYMAGSGTAATLGEVLVEKRFVTPHQIPLLEKLAAATDRHKEYHSRADMLFGNLVVECNLATGEDLDAALGEQVKFTEEGEKLRLGQILVQSGMLTLSQVKSLLSVQKKRILSCASCGAQYNISGYRPGLVAKCTSCGAALKTPGEVKNLEVKGDISSGAGEKPAADAPSADKAGDKFMLGAERAVRPVGRKERKAADRFGGFEILEQISRGGMGVIYKARQVGLNRIVALKMLLAGRTARSKQLKQFYREAEAIAQLNHPNILLVYDVGQHKGEHYISMEFIHGDDLSHLIDSGAIETRRALSITRDVASALAYAHLHGILHRDVKPANIMVERNTARVLLMDFGIATIRKDSAGGSERSAYAVGTPPYMAPEQADPHGHLGEVDTQSDLYSLGAVLYEMLTGKRPLSGKTSIELVYKIIHENPKRPTEISPDIPPDAEAICLKAMAKNKKDRYATWEEFIYDIDCFLENDAAAVDNAPSAGIPAWKVIFLVIATIVLAGIIIIQILLAR
jgi:tRNA A-37 threonylcarbamoyl transferase component Bud32